MKKARKGSPSRATPSSSLAVSASDTKARTIFPSSVIEKSRSAGVERDWSSHLMCGVARIKAMHAKKMSRAPHRTASACRSINEEILSSSKRITSSIAGC